jgi:hypothetical protein
VLKYLHPATTFLAFTFAAIAFSEAANGEEKYTLRYKLEKGEKLISRVVHLAETTTVMQGLDEDSHSRSVSEKVWEVTDVDSDGNMTFVYSIDFVEMEQSVGDGEKLRYNSNSDEEVPRVFRQVAETVKKPLASITINSRGQVKNRDKKQNAPQMGVGDITVPLPEEAIAIGHSWSVPREIRVKLKNGAHKAIKVRELYKLEKVVAGLATLSIVTQPLTPVNDPEIESKLIQQMSKGKIKFDVDKGRLLSKELNWKEEVIGFNGPDSSLTYGAKFTEDLLPAAKRTARK